MTEEEVYKLFHAPRFAYILALLRSYGADPGSRVLDIGPSTLTDMIRSEFGIKVDTLGFGEDEVADNGAHYFFDLNLAQERENWRTDLPQYDFVVFGEVLEHLHTAPQLVLCFLKTLLAEHGILIVQTPNAAALRKRVKLVLGRNPYEMIRENTKNPGHFREYTVPELRWLAQQAGLHVEQCTTHAYFDARVLYDGAQVIRKPVVGQVKNLVGRALPPGMREGITLVLRNAP